LLAIVQTRLELLANEMEEERLRIGQLLLYGSIALFFFGLAIMLVTVFIVVLRWDNYRLFVLAALAALFFIVGLMVWRAFRRLAREKTRLFCFSLAELSVDRDQLTPPP
jgi:uncharacterized membrane protein YqjE